MSQGSLWNEQVESDWENCKKIKQSLGPGSKLDCTYIGFKDAKFTHDFKKAIKDLKVQSDAYQRIYLEDVERIMIQMGYIDEDVDENRSRSKTSSLVNDLLFILKDLETEKCFLISLSAVLASISGINSPWMFLEESKGSESGSEKSSQYDVSTKWVSHGLNLDDYVFHPFKRF